ncbi:hypothetical protein BATDEDRAFT_87558 [Batrachochytrium dendrobatidis JAM81]|uniref:Transmembrane protein 188 n=2 Tax=Batrachochytrium dendrobatidis TaxID=109871 RepID=F4P0M8_BATDJ|nr:uncharacterized protein BATDEDRAFT_87558 [Batrachochytrium dendrobatidis JAM81]EGF81308.1 hypothetical protein BATDEDRAFT_87558 [Batrachochytrium dendrobatidis JAM81]KAJ8329657.1 hypothetical protein O5D80_002223 [Batrachochytrium dendrobatidis]KAK5669553.1 hypothetical protein QVD99_003944 [Batrachochytrium dendrobatidis]OAJ38073.1 hypothetical protein BDEG_22041 [Batrachochytrium dendrobatidis JEL423]|eukprot:XP_006678164.1 hypothetical protein BATDEDRAFT_87558 [Batrachochytrium dendrobatidis JAM81]
MPITTGMTESSISDVEQPQSQQKIFKKQSSGLDTISPERRLGDSLNNERSFRDLIMFEERLQSNMTRIRGATLRWKVFLVALLLTLFGSAYIFYNSEIPVFEPSTDPHSGTQPQHTPWSALVFICSCSITLIFFASGMYKTKLLTQETFVARCNKTLKPFNMTFQESSGKIVFSRKVPREFQDGMQEYRASFLRRREQSAARRRSSTKKKA